MAVKGALDQTHRNLIKTIRSNVRLAHSLAADNDLNVLLDEYSKKFQKDAQGGKASSTDLTWLLEKVLAQVLAQVEREHQRSAKLKVLGA